MEKNIHWRQRTPTRTVLCSVLFVLIAMGAGASYMMPGDVEYHAVRTESGESPWEILVGEAWGEPEWLFDDGDVKSLLRVPNEVREDHWKHVYLLMHFDQQWDETNIPEMSIVDPMEGVRLVYHDVSLGSGVAYWEWIIRPQPAYEILKFPGWYGYDMHNEMTRLEVGTKCVIPEPMSVTLLALGLAGLGIRRFRR